jgi:hypothetical protein
LAPKGAGHKTNLKLSFTKDLKMGWEFLKKMYYEGVKNGLGIFHLLVFKKNKIRI